jgi:hypothetical protein
MVNYVVLRGLTGQNSTSLITRRRGAVGRGVEGLELAGDVGPGGLVDVLGDALGGVVADATADVVGSGGQPMN